MTDNEIIKALKCCSTDKNCCYCPYFCGNLTCMDKRDKDALNLINCQKAEIDNLEYTLLGVMHFVDKWLDEDELEQDEVKRAAIMREKILNIVEELQTKIIKEKNKNSKLRNKRNRLKAEIEKLKSEQDQFADIGKMYSEIKSEAVKEFAERLKERKKYNTMDSIICTNEMIDNLVAEMVGKS